MGERSSACNISVGEPQRKRPLGKPRRRWKDIKNDLKEIGWEGTDWGLFGSGEGQVVGPCGHGNEPLDSIKTGTQGRGPESKIL
jgi:hypothetical protein